MSCGSESTTLHLSKRDETDLTYCLVYRFKPHAMFMKGLMPGLFSLLRSALFLHAASV